MTNITAIKQASFAFSHRETTTREEKLNTARALAEWGIFSNRQIASLTGLSRPMVDAISSKTDGTGGNLPGESLSHIANAATAHYRGEVDELAIKRAINAGASTRMVSRLTGISQSAVSRASRKFAA